MKKIIAKRVKRALLICLTAVLVIEALIFVMLLYSKSEIEEYLEVYDTGTATYEDIMMVDLNLKDYVRIGGNETYDYVLSRSYWLFDATVMADYKRVDRMGSAFIYEGSGGKTYVLIETDDWCRYFRVYSISKGVLKDQ